MNNFWNISDINAATQRGWLDGKEYFKNKILKIIEKQKLYFMPNNDLGNSYINKEDLIEKIKEL